MTKLALITFALALNIGALDKVPYFQEQGELRDHGEAAVRSCAVRCHPGAHHLRDEVQVQNRLSDEHVLLLMI